MLKKSEIEYCMTNPTSLLRIAPSGYWKLCGDSAFCCLHLEAHCICTIVCTLIYCTCARTKSKLDDP